MLCPKNLRVREADLMEAWLNATDDERDRMEEQINAADLQLRDLLPDA